MAHQRAAPKSSCLACMTSYGGVDTTHGFSAALLEQELGPGDRLITSASAHCRHFER